MPWSDRVNDYVAHSKVGKYFQLENSGARRERTGTKFLTEIRAGLTTFFAMVISHQPKQNITYLLAYTCRLILFQSMPRLSVTVVELVSAPV